MNFLPGWHGVAFLKSVGVAPPLVVEYTTVGSVSVNRPTNATTLTVECIGGGGPGCIGGGTGTGGGGGGGAYAKRNKYNVTALSTVYVTVPAGGASNTATNGADAIVRETNASGAIIARANGGHYGFLDGGGGGGTGGTVAASTGDVRYAGGTGYTAPEGGGGGGAAGPNGAGANGSAGGASGGAPGGAGGDGNPASGQAGADGKNYGGGGASQYGGAFGKGAQGYVKLTWEFEPVPPPPGMLLHAEALVDAYGWHTVTAGGNAVVSTTQKKFGAGAFRYNSAYQGGPAGDIISVNDPNNDFSFGTGDFTIDFWLYIEQYSAIGGMPFDFRLGGQTGQIAMTFGGASGAMDVLMGGGQKFPGGVSSLSLNTWTHIALTRASGTLRLFKNGGQVGTAADSTNLVSGGGVAVGNSAQAGYGMQGYIDEFRVLKGTAAWTANFTLPTAPYYP